VILRSWAQPLDALRLVADGFRSCNRGHPFSILARRRWLLLGGRGIVLAIAASVANGLGLAGGVIR
jgi:hypothetical protein